VLYLPALLHFIPSAMLHDALLVMRGYVGSDQQVLQLDLPCKNVNVLQQVLPFALEAALKVRRLCLLALEAGLQLFKLLPLMKTHGLSCKHWIVQPHMSWSKRLDQQCIMRCLACWQLQGTDTQCTCNYSSSMHASQVVASHGRTMPVNRCIKLLHGLQRTMCS